MLRQDNQESLSLLENDELAIQPVSPPVVSITKALPLDLLAAVVEWLPFESAIAFMLTDRTAFKLFDNPHKLNNYTAVMQSKSDQSPNIIPYKQVNYLLLQSHFRKQQLDYAIQTMNENLAEAAGHSKKSAIVLGTAVGCVIGNAIVLPAPIISCIYGLAVCGGYKTIVGTSVIGTFTGVATGTRSGMNYFERTMHGAADAQKRATNRISISLCVLSLEKKTALQIQSLFAANDIARAKQEEMIGDIVSERPRRVKMEL